MKQLLEYKAFEILKDDKNREFLDKVKLENPDLYVTFLNMVSRKGLEISKEKYKEYDPKYIKQKNIELKKLKDKESKDKLIEKYVKELSSELNEINDILKKSELINISKKINNDKNIKNYFKNIYIKEQYKNYFKNITNDLKGLENLKHKLSGDTILFKYKLKNITSEIVTLIELDVIGYARMATSPLRLIDILYVQQYYDYITKTLSYRTFFRYEPTYRTHKEIVWSEEGYENYKSKEISKLTKKNLNIDEVYELIDKFSYILSEESYEDFKIIQNMEKYNL